MKTTLTAIALALCTATAALAGEVTPPPTDLVAAWQLAPFYTKYVSVEGLPVLASEKVSDYALSEAAFLIRQMVGHRPEILRAMATNRVRFVIMAPTELTTDVPEHSDLSPKTYWNRRARGLGATARRPAVSCGEENLLDLPGDPYRTENILIHEFSHAIHERGMNVVDPTFDTRLKQAFESAKAAGLWKGTYAMQNRNEYWAEAAQSWFDCNRVNDHDHGPIDTREKIRTYDPEVVKLLIEVFGDHPWRYAKPSKRPSAEKAHLAGFDVTKAGRFAWPKEAPALDAQGELLSWLEAKDLPKTSPSTAGKATTLHFINRRAQPVAVEWVDFEGKRQPRAEVRPGLTAMLSTFSGHVWAVVADGKVLGGCVAAENTGRVEIR